MGADGRRYRILERIASGGMGEVFLAESIGAHGVSKRVAIKRILPRRDGRGVDLFVQEARTALALSHANIVQVFELGVLGEENVLVMEYVDGVDLARLLEAQPGTRLPLEAALHVAKEALEGLGHAHGRTDDRGRPFEVVHCDIKPSNLLCSRDGEVKIADFGIARASSRNPGAGRAAVAGTAGYMAPEQEAGRPVDPRADVYGLGAVLFRTVAGRVHTPGATPAVAAEIGAPARLDEILARALAPRPEDRYPTAADMLHDLEAFAFAAGVLVRSRALAELVRAHVDAGRSRPARALDGIVRARARELAGGAGTEPFSSGTNIVLARSASGMTQVHIVMPEPLVLGGKPMPAPEAPRGARVPLFVALALAVIAGAVGVVGLLSARDRAAPREAGAPASILAVTTTPEGAAIRIDGQPAGVGPTVLEVSPGAHRVEVTARGYSSAAREVQLRRAARLAIQIALPREPEPPPPVLAVPGDAPAESPAGDADAGSPARRPLSGTGLLNVSSDPWARISIDGRSTGLTTPARGIRLPAGLHVVELDNPVVGVRRRFSVRIDAGQTATRRFRLAP